MIIKNLLNSQSSTNYKISWIKRILNVKKKKIYADIMIHERVIAIDQSMIRENKLN